MRALALLSFVANFLPAQEPGFVLEDVVTAGIDHATTMAFAPDGRLFVVERLSGQILVVQDGAIAGVWATVPVVTDPFNLGAMGIAVDPDFLHNGFVYVSHTRPVGSGGENAITRLTDSGGIGTNPTVLAARAPISFTHDIGPMTFGADGKLYVLHGDGGVDTSAPDLTNLHGKVWRVETPLGTVPTDNPFPGSWVYSYGHRNSFGIAVHPDTDELYQTENGALIEDELNVLLPGRNYGWPTHDGRELSPDPTTEDPLHTFLPQIAPTGCAFYGGPLYPPQYRGGWFVGDWNHGHLTLLDFDAATKQVRSSRMFWDFPQSVHDVVDGPDGNLWVLCSAQTFAGGDRIGRLVWQNTSRPALATQAVSTVAVGGSVTACVTGNAGELATIWLGAQRFPAGVPTPFGLFWVPPALILPGQTIPAGDRAFFPLAVPGDPALRGAVLHLQATTVAGGTQIRLSNPDAVRLR